MSDLLAVIAAATNARACEECGASVGEPCRVYCTGPAVLADHTTTHGQILPSRTTTQGQDPAD